MLSRPAALIGTSDNLFLWESIDYGGHAISRHTNSSQSRES
uniref:Uncharacterized protein n=1 Tax=Anguilla anguilla TaxID=7936 RepID=A0A0E9RR70_ANGAN